MTIQKGRRYPFGNGVVDLDPTGAVAQVTRGESRRMLLWRDGSEVEAAVHHPGRHWGNGFAIVDGQGHRFEEPSRIDWHADGVDQDHQLGSLRLHVSRRIGAEWVEDYELTNRSGRPVEIGTLAISTPWRDLYGSSRHSLQGATHAHVWTGGADAWVWAQPMDGSGPGLGLTLVDGELWAYSVESRDQFTGSNFRGHLYLHATDHGRAPHTFGGQPVLRIAGGSTWRLTWRLRWYDSLALLHADHPPAVAPETVSASVGAAISLRRRPGTMAPDAVTSHEHGVQHVDAVRGGRRSRIAVLHHLPLRTLTERRVQFLLQRQRPAERPGTLRYAFVPYDNRSQLTLLGGGWEDWSDGRERIGSAILLQEVRRRGWGDSDEVQTALDGYRRFVLEHLVGDDGTVFDDSSGSRRRPRLYNFPWFSRFLMDEGDLSSAAAVMSRFYELGGRRYLAFELGQVIADLSDRLRSAGRATEAEGLTGALLDQANHFLALGDELPAHEVNYEQSMVAPLLDLLLAAEATRPGSVPEDELRNRLRWLTAFAADQPDPRMQWMPIRHWDGYWFGALRLWGDTFPHYWSVLSAAVYLRLPEGLLSADETLHLRRQAELILRGNLTGFDADGSATCAFVYPSCVNGQPAHLADPLANDQDWALVYALRHLPVSM